MEYIRFIESHDLRKMCMRGYRDTCSFSAILWGVKQLHEITSRDIEMYVETRLCETRDNYRKVNRELSILKYIFGEGVRLGYIEYCPPIVMVTTRGDLSVKNHRVVRNKEQSCVGNLEAAVKRIYYKKGYSGERGFLSFVHSKTGRTVIEITNRVIYPDLWRYSEHEKILEIYEIENTHFLSEIKLWCYWYLKREFQRQGISLLLVSVSRYGGSREIISLDEICYELDGVDIVNKEIVNAV